MISQASQNQTDDQVMFQNKNFKLKEAVLIEKEIELPKRQFSFK